MTIQSWDEALEEKTRNELVNVLATLFPKRTNEDKTIAIHALSAVLGGLLAELRDEAIDDFLKRWGKQIKVAKKLMKDTPSWLM